MLKKLRFAWIVTAGMALAGAAQAEMVAGWDFSAWGGENFMDTDGTFVYQNTLESNYSDLDPTFGAGKDGAVSPDAAPCGAGASCEFGMLYFDGSFGSTNVPETPASSVNGPFTPLSGSLAPNLDAPGTVDFDNAGVLGSRGAALYRPAAA